MGGYDAEGGNCTNLDFKSTTSVYSTSRAFAAFDASRGVVQCWGSPDFGGDCSDFRLHESAVLYSNDGAFVALDVQNGTAICWGSIEMGGDCSRLDFRQTTDIYASGQAFVALSATLPAESTYLERSVAFFGHVVVWIALTLVCMWS